MFKFLKQLFELLNPSQRKRFFILQTLVIIMAFAEVVGVASIFPFMALVGDMSQLYQDTIIAQVYKFSGIKSETQFIFILGVSTLVMLIISATISMFTVWRLSMFANKIGAEVADKLYTYYLKQSWLFHSEGSSAQLTKKIATETLRVTTSLLTPIMLMNAKIGLVILMVLSLFFYDPVAAITGFSLFGIAYFVLYKVVRKRLQQNGKNISEVNEKRFRLMNEGFGGIKDILLLGRDEDFIKRFKETGQALAYSSGANVALSQVPRYFMELVAFGTMLGLLLYLIVNYESDLGKILPILSVYAFASIKLLPAFQQIYASTANIKGNVAALESIQLDLMNAMKTKPVSQEIEKGYIIPKKEISLEHITFNYPNKQESTLNQLNMSISANTTVGIVGPSGSGKSTLIDIILCLIKPQHGSLKVDGEIINNQNCRMWQNTIGFVAQSIFLSEGTIAENVAFGIPTDQINKEQVLYALKQAHLGEFVENLEKGINTKVGERGVQLSGGQRQRIGIARALYHKAEVLVFDEATSSLDGITEKKIMKAIHDLKDKKTIILIAHRLKTVKNCDSIFFISDGHLVGQGSYDELINRNKQFKTMAEHS